MATKKTLYIPDADEVVWEKAEKLSDESLSQLVNNLLRKEVARLEARASLSGDLEKIVIDVSTVDENNCVDGGTRKVAFIGKWLVEDSCGYSVALTAKNQILVYREDTFNGLPVSTYNEPYASFAAFEKDEDIPSDIKQLVADALDEDYEEFLDI